MKIVLALIIAAILEGVNLYLEHAHEDWAKGKGKGLMIGLAMGVIVIGLFVELADRRAAEASEGQTLKWQAKQDARQDHQEEILRYLKNKEQTVEARLSAQYPYGFALIGGAQGSFEHLPLRNQAIDGKHVDISADWTQAQLDIDTIKNLATISIPHMSWRTLDEHGLVLGTISDCDFVRTFPLIAGTTVRSPINLGGQVNWFLEVIDPDPHRPVFAIGFKAQDSKAILQRSKLSK